MIEKLKQMFCEAAVIALALAMFTALLFFGSGVWEAGKPEPAPWSKPSTLERELAPWMQETATGRFTTSGYGFYDRKRERGK